MKAFVPILILICCASMCRSENPGLVAAIKMPIIEKVKNQYFVSAFQQFGHQTVPDQSEGDLHVSNIRVDMSNTSPNNLKVSFVKASNAIGVDIENTGIVVNVDWRFKKSIISVSGDAKVSGTIGGIAMGIVLTKMQEGSYFIPQIGVNNFNLNMDKGAFSLDFHCNHCPGEIEKLISGFLKDKLLDAVRSAIISQTPSQVTSIGNTMLNQDYPRAVSIFSNIDVATAMIGDIAVQDDHLEVPLDSTIFLHTKGYNRPGPAPEIPGYNPKDPGDVMMFFSPYLLSTLSDTLNQGPQSYSVSFYGINVDVTLDPSQGQTSLALEDGDLSAKFSPMINLPSYGVGLQMTATAQINPTILQGDDTNMFYVTPSIKSMTLSSLSLFVGSVPIDLSFMVVYLNAFVQAVINKGLIPTIAVAKLAALPIHVINSELDFHKAYSEFGILFDFGM
uniref:Bactericidal permeability-increasing protein n=1 Tax=Euplotes harpa TaxID=151035 RepID=A0A7S3JNE7_9SPIT|mmetsp:Transcript_7230/g.8209  ORF Transcript_7230/g.8209 Transcript_7230/m.8209 type:complete len:447 (+) Transcript_7230:3-1343(+)